MFIRLLLLFTIVPVIELIVLLKIGAIIGVASTVILILLTGIAGAYLARTQGLDLLRRIQSELNQGRVPAGELLDGALVLVGGVLLLTPGFCTDLLGFSFLVPTTRAILKGLFRSLIEKHIAEGKINIRRM